MLQRCHCEERRCGVYARRIHNGDRASRELKAVGKERCHLHTEGRARGGEEGATALQVELSAIRQGLLKGGWQLAITAPPWGRRAGVGPGAGRHSCRSCRRWHAHWGWGCWLGALWLRALRARSSGWGQGRPFLLLLLHMGCRLCVLRRLLCTRLLLGRRSTLLCVSSCSSACGLHGRCMRLLLRALCRGGLHRLLLLLSWLWLWLCWSHAWGLHGLLCPKNGHLLPQRRILLLYKVEARLNCVQLGLLLRQELPEV